MNFFMVLTINVWDSVKGEKPTENALNNQRLRSSSSSFIPQLDRYQSNNNDYVSSTIGLGGYAGYGGLGTNYNALSNNYGSYYNNPYYARNLEGYAGYPANLGYIIGYPDYKSGAYINYPSYNTLPYNSYYDTRLGGSYPINRSGYGYRNYPSSYYSNNYGNSIVGGGLGGLNTPGSYIPPVGLNTAGYHYSPGITGSVY